MCFCYRLSAGVYIAAFYSSLFLPARKGEFNYCNLKTIKPQLKAEKNLYCILIFLTISFAFLFFFISRINPFSYHSLIIPIDSLSYDTNITSTLH